MKTCKIDFDLEVVDGFPPIAIERLNATACDDGTYRIENSPFFVSETAYGDVVTVSAYSNGRFKFVTCIKESPYKAISIIILDEAMDTQLMDDLRGLDCIIEYGEFGIYRMLAVGVPPSTDYGSIKKFLDIYESDGKLSYSELVV
jgi:hypothetical protein